MEWSISHNVPFGYIKDSNFAETHILTYFMGNILFKSFMFQATKWIFTTKLYYAGTFKGMLTKVKWWSRKMYFQHGVILLAHRQNTEVNNLSKYHLNHNRQYRTWKMTWEQKFPSMCIIIFYYFDRLKVERYRKR